MSPLSLTCLLTFVLGYLLTAHVEAAFKSLLVCPNSVNLIGYPSTFGEKLSNFGKPYLS